MADDDGAARHERTASGALGAWWRQGARCAFLRAPRWDGLQTTPAIVAWLLVVPWLLALLVERLYIVGPADFYWPALLLGWLSTVVTAWLCWLLVPGAPAAGNDAQAPSAAALFAMLAAQGLTFVLVVAAVFVPLVQAGLFVPEALGPVLRWSIWLLPLAWIAVAEARLLWRASVPRRMPRLVATVVVVAVLAMSQWAQPLRAWYPAFAASTETAPERLALTQELLELQPHLLAERLQALRPERKGVVDVYAITFAPYADEDVFRKESEMVVKVMEQRFDAEGRTVQLVNSNATARQLPWATPLNLQRAIRRAGELMNRDEDVLFVHLTSHGAGSGQLSARFRPLSIESVTPGDLRRWLDEAGIRYRVVSVSACYSGSWIEPLAGEGTLVMTAADADHTSYGCGRGSELTYFGRAMFDEQLRHTRSFEQAHAAARAVIEQREQEAGKSDGYSNPQIRVGADIRSQLSRLTRELEEDDARVKR
jgi:hypothetical protein